MSPAIPLIRFYQRFISPHKGFSCAYRIHTGEDSCSHAVKKIIEEKGLFAGLPDIRRRFHECRIAGREIRLSLENAGNEGGDSKGGNKEGPFGKGDCLAVPCDCAAGCIP
ncbi:MAG: hypothetical protein CMO80_17770 [Verrucomicrobiales bacterium]|nr:hypothetical protein [Verrucomicrobiales bacterium]|tara:strand:- start:1058 stop:1387 length:330 start_codon:yes stop_codon:yes gene_type:complete